MDQQNQQPSDSEKKENVAPPQARQDAGAQKADAGAPGAPEAGGAKEPGKEKPRTAAPRGRGKEERRVSVGVAHIKATFNNTIVSIADVKGEVIAWSSAGRVGFKGTRKSTAFAASLVGQDAGKQAAARGMREVEVRIQGGGAGRETAVRALQAAGINIALIKDVTPVPHNGCRARKRRRV